MFKQTIESNGTLDMQSPLTKDGDTGSGSGKTISSEAAALKDKRIRELEEEVARLKNQISNS